jgi:hypothetical protein
MLYSHKPPNIGSFIAGPRPGGFPPAVENSANHRDSKDTENSPGSLFVFPTHQTGGL